MLLMRNDKRLPENFTPMLTVPRWWRNTTVPFCSFFSLRYDMKAFIAVCFACFKRLFSAIYHSLFGRWPWLLSKQTSIHVATSFAIMTHLLPYTDRLPPSAPSTHCATQLSFHLSRQSRRQITHEKWIHHVCMAAWVRSKRCTNVLTDESMLCRCTRVSVGVLLSETKQSSETRACYLWNFPPQE